MPRRLIISFIIYLVLFHFIEIWEVWERGGLKWIILQSVIMNLIFANYLIMRWQSVIMNWVLFNYLILRWAISDNELGASEFWICTVFIYQWKQRKFSVFFRISGFFCVEFWEIDKSFKTIIVNNFASSMP